MRILGELNCMNMRFQLYSLACLLMAFLGSATAQNSCFQYAGDTQGFGLSVETFATDGVSGMTTYRVYLNTPNANDFVSAVIGDQDTPLFLNTTTSFYQDALGGTTPASINPMFYTLPGFEGSQYDSWVTIGIEQQPDLGAGETEVSVLVDPNVDSWELGFGSGGNVDISSPIGGGWYILPSSTNGISGDDQKVLLAQLTTAGEVSGQFFIQIFPEGDQAQLIETTFSFAQIACSVDGCTDQAACNYNSEATNDDGTCTYAAANFDCDGNCLTTPTTFTVDMNCSGETFSTVHVTGPWCGWCGAESYNTLTDADGDGVYSVDVCIPAGDVEYKYMIDNWAAQEDLVDDAQSGLSCAAVTDAATYANRMTTAGSTTADTYGSCYTCEEQAANALGCTDSAAVNYNENATNDDGSCLFAVTFRVDMANFDGPAYSVVNVNGSFNGWCGTCNPLDDSNGDGIWEATLNLPAGTIEYKFTLDGWTQQEEFAPGGACTTTIDGFTNRSLLIDGAEDLTAVCWNSCDVCVASPGCTDQEAVNYDSTALNEDGSCQYAVTFQVDMSQYGLTETDGVFLNGAYNGWCGGCNAMDDVDGDGVYTFTVNLTLGLQEYKFTVNGWDAAESFDGTESCTTDPAEFVNRVVDVTGNMTLPVVCWNSCEACPAEGCTDALACNYDEAAGFNDGSCVYADGNCESCDNGGVIVSDADGDGVCDADEVVGCTDASACNYNGDATDTDNTLCTFPADEHVDCDGNCIADADGDGVCDGLEVAGCTDATACNYSNTATDDNGSCYFCCGETSSDNAQYGLEQEIVAFDGIPGMRTYRFYITTPNADDIVSAVSGDENNPTIVSTTTSFYQDELGGVFPDGINPTLYDAFPSLQYDSWMTIGIDQAPDLAGGESAIGLAEAESWTTEFENGESFAIDGFFGGAWYATSDFTNGVSGDDQRVLLAQLTTDGDLSGQFYVQVFPNGEAEGLGDLVMLSFGPHVDTVAPSFVDFPADVTVGCDDALPTADIQAEDLCSELSVSLEEVTSGDGCLTTVARTYTATDAAGNSTSATWTISVVDDAAPVFSAPADITVNCGDDISPASLGEVTSATDCNGYTISFNDATMFNMDPCIGEKIARTWRVADDCGNEAIDIQIITIVDAAAPSFAQVPADTTISCDAVVPTSAVVAQDDCGSVTVSSSDETLDGECAGSATILRTFTAVDPCGNSSQYVQTITVIDTVAPVFTSVPADLTVGVYDDLPASAAEASDNCSSVTVLQSEETDASANDFALVIRTFTAVDACGNSTTATQTITVLEALGCTDAFACNYDNAATADDGSCDYCSCDGVYAPSGPYNVDIDTIVDGIDGLTTYQVYVTLENADDFLSAVTGDLNHPTFIRSNTSFYQSPIGSANAHNINPMLVDAFPELAYDSWVTVGLTNTADPGAGEGEVSLVEGEPWVAAFEAGQDIDLTGEYGGGWFSLNGSSNGVAGDDLRVLVGQFTTDGVFSGQMYVQVFPHGNGENMSFQTLRWGEPQCGCQLEDACNYDPTTAYTDNDNCIYPEDLYGAAHFDCDGVCLNDLDGDGVCDEDEVPGCMDDTACNFSDMATDDDGTCWYADYGYYCDGTCIGDADFDGICDLNELAGCNLPTACNYDPAATENDGSCTFDCYGCTDAAAANYDADALLDDGSCFFGGCTDADADNYSADADFNDGSCEYLGCTNPIACNYTPGANVDDGSCDLVSCGGCTNPIACNYDETALLNDGSCEFFSCRGCTDADAFNYNGEATVDDGSCIFGGCTDAAAANYDESADFNDGSCQYGGCTDAGACNFDPGANLDDGTCDFTSCAGCMVTFACNYDAEATIQDDSACDFTSCCGDPAADNYDAGVADFLTYGCVYGGNPPMIQMTGCELPFACNFGDTENPCEFSSCAGCDQEGACNYDPDATIPLTCVYPAFDYVDCDGNCLNDTNGNGLCDETETSGCTNPLACNYVDGATIDDGSCDTTSCAGCTDATACNYDASASINDGSCDYVSCFGCTDALACNYDETALFDDGGCAYPASALVDCDGNCINDGNGNGICDEQETLGCTDLGACNFDPAATFDDGSCESVSCAGCTNPAACNYDASASINDGSCDFTSCLGCTDALACNYDADATQNDGSCVFPEPEYDCEGECLVDSDGDGICDAFDGNFDGCMDELACNYEPLADMDDGSCDFCSCSGYTTDLPGYGVDVEEVAVNGIPGYNTYRVYITTPNATDKVSAVTGQTENPMFIETTGDFYQHPNGGVFPNGINPILFGFIPEIQYDSWFTIGIDGVPNTALGQGSVQGLPEPQPWSASFEAGNGFVIDDIIGSGWFVNPDVTNGIAGDDHRVLLAQLTTNGELNGQFYVQVFPEGNNLNQERVTLTFGGSQCGCTDIEACNYSSTAIIDDESCYYPQFGYECGDVCLFDDEAPTFTEVPEDEMVSCTANIEVSYPAATDNCSADLIFSHFDEIVDGPCGETYDIIRTYVVADVFGHTDTTSHIIHVVDEQAPIFTNVPADADIACGDVLPTAQAVAVDNCNGVTITYTDETIATGCGATATIVRHWTATDACGNASMDSTVYTIVDDIAPVLVDVPADVTISCSEDYGFPMPTGTDACSDVEISEDMSTVAGDCANAFVMTRIFTATDACGNTSEATQVVTIVDLDAPSIDAAAASLTVECDGAGNQDALDAWLADHGGAEASDLCGDVTWSHDFTALSDGCGATGAATVTFTATDACGNSSTTSAVFTIEDTTAPTFTVPADVTLDCSADVSPAGAGDVADAMDACSDATVSYSDVVTDGAFTLDGLTADIRVELRLNNLAAFPRVLEATGVTIGNGMELDLDDEVSNPLNLRGAVGVDISGENIALSVLDVISSESYDYVEVRISNMAGAGIVGATLNADQLLADASGADFDLSFSSDEIVMSWSEVAGSMLSIVNGGTASITANGASNCIDQNIITRTWTVIDACGNSVSADQIITLEDLTAPVFDFVPEDVTLDCNGSYDTEMATATDACSGVTVTFADSESFPCDGSRVIERTFTAQDGCGNVATHVQTISFLDTTAPVFTATPEDLALDCSEALPVTSAEASDDCGSVTVTYADETVAGDCAGDYTVVRTFTAEDGCGNSNTYVQNIVYTDTTAPVILSAPADTTYQVLAGQPMPVDFPVAEDACGSVDISFTDVCSNVTLGGYDAVRTFTISDDCGNSTEVVQTLTVTFATGCDDPAATNYDPTAMAGDGSCLYAGCTNPEALNYNPLADEDDGSCVVADIEGCTDPGACNYFEAANVEDGSCDYCSCVNAPVIDGYSIELETVAVDGVPGMTTYRLYATMVNPTDVLSSVVGEDGLETYINTSTSFYQDPFGGALGQVINPILFGLQPTLEYDSYVTIGLTEPANTQDGEIEVTAVESEGANWILPFEAGGNIAIDGAFGGAWFTLNGATNAQAGDDLRVLLGQFTTSGTLSGQISLQVFPEGDGENDLVMTFPIGNPGCGCTDLEACNYVDGASFDDGSCTYTGIYDCDGETCMNDLDGDGVCDEFEVPGCTDAAALNFVAAATDEDGSCLFLGCMDPEADNYDVLANVEGDCTYPMEGCMDSDAVNYDDSALVDDGSCLYLGCMDPEAENFDPNANVAGFCAYPAEGCTDAAAVNYDAGALTDDGSCLYPGCTDETALNYDPNANFDSGCILPLEGCTDPMAENFNPLANTNDGSCEYTPPCPGDLNGDGTININDLLDFFQIYGSDCAE